MLKTLAAAAAMVSASLCAPAVSYAADAERWNEPPYTTVVPLVTSSDAEIDAAIDQITDFPKELDPRLWAGDKMRPDVRARVLEIVNALFADLKMADVTIKNVEVQGSTVSYEYDDNADLSVRVFIDTSKYKGDVKGLNTLLKTYTDYLEAAYEGRILLRGVFLEPQFYAIKSASLEPQPGIGHYSVTEDAWMERPSIQESHFDRDQMKLDAKRIIAEYNLLISDYFADKKSFDCGRLTNFTKEMRSYRGAGIDKYGTRSTSNLTYRMLRRLNVNVSETVRHLAGECRAISWSLE